MQKSLTHLKKIYSNIRTHLLDKRGLRSKIDIATVTDIGNIARESGMCFDPNLTPSAGLKLRVWQKAHHMWTRIHLEPLFHIFEARYFANLLIELLQKSHMYLGSNDRTSVEKLKDQIAIEELVLVMKQFPGKKFSGIPVVKKALSFFDKIIDDMNDSLIAEEIGFTVTEQQILESFGPFDDPVVPNEGTFEREDDADSPTVGKESAENGVSAIVGKESDENGTSTTRGNVPGKKSSGRKRKKSVKKAAPGSKRKKYTPPNRLVHPPRLRNLRRDHHCFINAFIQVLFATPGFNEAVTRSLEESADANSISHMIIEMLHKLNRERKRNVDLVKELLGITMHSQEDAFEAFHKMWVHLKKYPRIQELLELKISHHSTNSPSYNEPSPFLVLKKSTPIQEQLDKYFDHIDGPSGVHFALDGMGTAIILCLSSVFGQENESGIRQKVPDKVPRISERITILEKSFRLIGVLLHSGDSIAHGHYYSVIERFGKRWLVNDTHQAGRNFTTLDWISSLDDTPYGLCYTLES